MSGQQTSGEMFVVMERTYVHHDEEPTETVERPVGLFFDEQNASKWCDSEMPRHLWWTPVPVLDA